METDSETPEPKQTGEAYTNRGHCLQMTLSSIDDKVITTDCKLDLC